MFPWSTLGEENDALLMKRKIESVAEQKVAVAHKSTRKNVKDA